MRYAPSILRLVGSLSCAVLILSLAALAPAPAMAEGKACVVSGFKLTNKFGSTAVVKSFYVDREGNTRSVTFKGQTKNLEAGQSSTIKFDENDTDFANKEVWGWMTKVKCTGSTNCRKDGTKLYVEMDPDTGKPRGPIWHYKLENDADFCHSRCQFENTECVPPLNPDLLPGK